MAYYPGIYKPLTDYYTQALFSPPTTPWSHDFDPYTDPSHHHKRSRSRSPSLHRAYATHIDPSSPPPSSSPPRSSPPPQHLDHPPERSPSPTTLLVPTEPPPALPSPSYLEFMSKPSKTLSEPTRKLLVLDLNGSLLLRSQRIPKSYRGHHQHNQRPAPRRVMPRPYLPALRAYIFAPQTRAWLDVMVWSSAQPHSVEDMVLHAFGDDRDQLVAIWARDTLGLAEGNYYRKVQTIKDLEKPWAALTSQHPALKAKLKLYPSSQTQTWTGHSAATTILLDDSQAKAALQPHNHLCVTEYTRLQRNSDQAALKQAYARAALREAEGAALQDGNDVRPRKRRRKRAKDKDKEQQQPMASAHTVSREAEDVALQDDLTERPQKRKREEEEEKEKEQQPTVSACAVPRKAEDAGLQDGLTERPQKRKREEEKEEEEQPKVSAGAVPRKAEDAGLQDGPTERPQKRKREEEKEKEQLTVSARAVPSKAEDVGLQNGLTERLQKRKREEEKGKEKEKEQQPTVSTCAVPRKVEDAGLQDGLTDKPQKRKREEENEKESQQPTSSAPLPTINDPHVANAADTATTAAAPASAPEPVLDETLLGVVGILHAARLQSSIAGWMHDGALLSDGRSEVWCDDPALVHTWALRGRDAMQELGLEVEHGIVPDP